LVHQDYVNSVDFSSDGRQLITGSDEHQVRIWDLPLPCPRGIPLVKSNPALSMAYLDPSLVCASPRTRVSGSQGRPIPHWVRECLCAAFSSDGRLVVTGTHDFQARVREVAIGRLVGKALPHQNWVRAVARELGGLGPVCGWCAERAENLERIHQHEAALWFRQWIVAADPKNAQTHDDLGQCLARLGQLDKASEHFTHAVMLAPECIDYQRDLAMARLALNDRVGFRQACARLIQFAEATDSPEAAYTAALACVFDSSAVEHWDGVVRLVARAAEGYDGDIRIRVAALFRAGRIDEALQLPWSTDERCSRFAWEWFFQGLLRLQAGRHKEARDILGQLFKLTDFMDQAMPREAKSKVWSDWIYYVQCHALRKEAEGLLRDASPRGNRE
jgi:hypothetical protein